MHPNKTEVYRFRMTAGDNRLDAYQNVQSPAVGILDAKIHINITISDAHKGARYCTANIKDFFLCSIMPIYQYMHICSQMIIDFNLKPDYFDSKGYGNFEIQEGMYGINQAAILAYEQL